MTAPRLTQLLIALLLTAPAPAEVFRWVDEDGRLQFTQTPPPVGTTFQLVYPPAPPAEPKERRGMDAFLAEREAKREREKQEAARKRERAEQRRAACDAARKRLAWLQSRPPFRLAVTNPQGGYTRMTVEQYARETEKAHQAADENCRER